MAKRKRLTPAQPGFLERDPGQTEGQSGAPAGLGAAPIAQVTGDSATRAALDEVTGVLQDARANGRLIESLALDVIDQGYLVRDRLVQDEEEMAALIDSLRARGQQTPVEVIALPDPDSQGRQCYGLISGWRRLTALRRLYNDQGDDQFATIKALVIAPNSARESYVAMVEENEIRVNLSLYERARIALSAMHQEIYPTSRTALQGLFGSTTRSKRSKIGTFMIVVEALDSFLRHPTAIPEKLGLGLAQMIERDSGFRSKVCAALNSDPHDTPEQELRILTAVLAKARRNFASESSPETPAEMPLAPETESVSPEDLVVRARPRPRIRSTVPDTEPNEHVSKQITRGLTVGFVRGQRRIDLTGADVTQALYEDLQDWLMSRRS